MILPTMVIAEEHWNEIIGTSRKQLIYANRTSLDDYFEFLTKYAIEI